MLNKKLENYNIILGSGSPRRKELLKSLGLEFTIKTKDIVEDYPKYLHGSEITNYIAELKASAFIDDLKEDDLLITADTVVRIHGKILGKPKDRDDAIAMLQELSNTAHEVITSICFTSLDKQRTFHDATIVHFRELTQEEIEFYIDTFKPFDKAGAYGIQEWIGLIAITKINGSYYNVVGFPVHKFYKEIMQF